MFISQEQPVAILSAEEITKVFGATSARVEALRGVSLEVATGEFVAIVGPSGSGKSTLLHILGGLEFPSSGRVLIEDVDLAALDDDRRTIFRRQRIGFVFQRFNLLPNLTAAQNVALPLMLDRVPVDERTRRAIDTLARVDLSHRQHAYPKTMSGGEQQRVAVARALVTSPALILADEPTGMLDRANCRSVAGLLRSLVEERGHTVVIVTHDEWVAAQADRQLHVVDGKIADVAATSR